MTNKEVWLVLTDRWADWEAAYAMARINEAPGFVVRIVAEDLQPKASIGGLRAQVDSVIEDGMDMENVAMLVLPGGYAWREDAHTLVVRLVQRAVERGVPVAAICGATQFLARNGFLDAVRHTGDERELFLQEEVGYAGLASFEEAQVVCDGGFITANETAAVEFGYEICKALGIDEELEEWYAYFRDGLVQKG